MTFVQFESKWHLSRFSLCLLVLLWGTACSPFDWDDGRPTVLSYSSDYVIDYNAYFEELSLDGNEEVCDKLRKQPLSPEMFDSHQPLDQSYGLARGDVLEISVQGEDETTVENAIVAPDGKLYYAFLDGIPAAGRRPEEVAREIQEEISHFFISPMVSVVPKESYALQFYVLGRVKTPGAYPFKGPVTLAEGIAEAGGLLSHNMKDYDYARRYLIPYVDLQSSFLVRNHRKLDIDFERLVLSGDQSQNIYLRPEDYIYLAPSDHKDIFILGPAIASRRLTYFPEMTLLQALGTAGGWPTPGPHSPDFKRIVVIRDSLEHPKVCYVDLDKILVGDATDLLLHPGDIVYAPDKLEPFGREMVLLAITTFIDTFASAAGSYVPRAYWWDTIQGAEVSDGD